MAFPTWQTLFRSRSLGLEMTDTVVKWMDAGVSKGSPVIYAADAEKLDEGTVKEGKIVQKEPVVQAIRKLRQRNGANVKRVHWILPSTLAMVRVLKMPDVPDKKLKRMIDIELKYHMPFPFDQPQYDFLSLPRLHTADGGEASKERDVMIIAAPLPAVEELATLTVQAGLKPATMEIKPLSLLRCVQHFDPKEASSTMIIIDLTSTYTDISIYDGGILRMTSNKSIRFPAAEQAEAAHMELMAACQELSFEVDRFINFYRYTLNHRDREVERIFVSGEISCLSEVISNLNEHFPNAVRKLSIPAAEEQRHGPLAVESYAGVFGAALRGRER